MNRLKWMRRIVLGLLVSACLFLAMGIPGRGDMDPVPGPKLPPPPGTIVLSDQTLVYPDGTVIYGDGFFIMPDGTSGYLTPEEMQQLH